MIVRPEAVEDYARIGSIHAQAFGNRAHEAIIVALLRQRSAFDPELSLVAEFHGRVVGHVLFTPCRIRLLDRDVAAVNLAPIGIDPAMQRQGIGSALIEQGHAVAREKGFQLSFLLGHHTYYPRFGYQTGAYGAAGVQVDDACSPVTSLTERDISPGDVATLQELWRRDQAAVDFAIEPGEALLDWLSPNPAVKSVIYERDGETVGYARVDQSQPTKPRAFLARDGQSAREIARILQQAAIAAGAGSVLTLPIHPASQAGSGFPAAPVIPWRAAMACPLAPGVLDDYFACLETNSRQPGTPIWPVAFELE